VALHPNSVAVFDIKSARIVADVAVGHGAAGIATGGGLVWVANVNENSVTQIDLKTYTPRTVGIGITPDVLAADDRGAWASDGSKAVMVYPDQSFEGFTIPGCRDGCTGGIAVTNDDVWIGANPTGVPSLGDAGTVKLFDAHTHKVRDRVHGVASDQLALGSGSIWAYGAYGFWLTQVDLKTHTVLSRLRLPPDIGEGVYTSPGVAYGYGYAWALSPLGALYRVTPDGHHLRTIAIPSGASGVAAGAGSIWVTVEDGTLLRIDPYRASIRRYRVGQDPLYLTIADTKVWITLTGE
jgi:streptogramin lyase